MVAVLSHPDVDALDRLDLRAARAGDEVNKEGEMTDRELDLLIAKHVFGANLTPTKNISVSTPAFSTTGDGMLAVIEKMRERGFWVSLTTRRIDGYDFLAKVWNFEVEKSEAADTAPRAVAIAALRALGVEL